MCASLIAQHANQIGHAFERFLKCADIGNLRPDVYAHSGHFQITLLRSLGVERLRLGNRHAEFVLMQSGRNVGVSFRRDVWIDSHRYRCSFLQSGRGC